MLPLNFLERHIGSYKLHKSEALFQCPCCHHHKPKLSVNTDFWFWKCWVCDAKGRSVFSLVWRLEDADALAQYKACFPNHIQAKSDEVPANFVMQLPDEYVPLCSDTRSFHAKRALNYLKRRNIGTEQILRHKIGYCMEGPYENRIILPSFDAEGRVNFFTARTFVNDSYKYMNPSTPHNYTNSIIINELNVDWTRPLFLVEGFMDMLRVGDNAVPLFRSTLVEESSLFINMVLHQSEVYVCLDADARKKQFDILRSLLSYGVRCYDFDVSPYKDLAEMPEPAFVEKRTTARRASRISILRGKLHNL